MNTGKDTISMLITKRVIGTISPEEQAVLDAWREGDPLREASYQRFLNDDWLTNELNRLSRTDCEAPLSAMKQRLGISGRNTPIARYLAAAAVALLLVAGAAALWYRDYARVVPPELTAEVRQAMQQATRSSKNEATVEALKPADVRRISRQYAHTSASASVEAELLAARKITTRSDKEFWQTLPDGSVVHLNYNTRLIYPEQFEGQTRDVVLDGEAYFMVARDKRHPFIVHTPQGDVTVHGTEFNVSTRGAAENGEGTTTEVVLVRGSVSVQPAGGGDWLMQPGQKCSMLNTQCSIAETDTEPYVAWNAGKFAFYEWPLERVMSVLARWYGYDVAFAADELKAIEVSGNFDRYDDIRPTVEALETVTGLRIELNGTEITINN